MTLEACKGQPDVIEPLNDEEKIIIALCCKIELIFLTTCERNSTKYLKCCMLYGEKLVCNPFKAHSKKITNK